MSIDNQAAAEAWVTTLFAAIDNRRWDDLEALASDQVCYERPGYDALVGKAAFMHFYQHVRIIKSGKHTVDGVIWRDDAIVYHGSFVGESHSGEALSVAFCDVCELDGNLLRTRKTYFYTPAV